MSKQQPWSVMQDLGDWYVVMEWPNGVEDGGPGRLVIQPVAGTYPVGGLSSTVLRQIDFGKAIEDFRGQIAASQRRSREYEKYARLRVDQLRAALADGVTDEYLSRLSSEYVRAVTRGQAKVNDYLAELVGKPTSTVRGHLWQARKQGFLTGSPGRKGGELGPKANAVLERIAPDDLESLTAIFNQVRGAET
jgi:hypothetical protein